MFRRSRDAVSLLILAILMVIATPVAYGGEPTSEDALGMVKEVSGAFYGPPYNLVLPDPIIIEEPSANVPKECARWLGVWAGGKWDGTRPAGLIVHSVSFIADGLCGAKVTLATGVSSARPRGAPEPRGTGGRNLPRMFQDLSAYVYSGEGLAIKRRLGLDRWSFSYKMSDSGNALLGSSVSDSGGSEASFKRMKPPYGPSTPATAMTRVFQ